MCIRDSSRFVWRDHSTWNLQVVLLGRVAGKVRNHRMSILQIEHYKDRVGSFTVLGLDDGVLDAHRLGGHVVFENGLAVQTNPRIGRAGNRDLDVGVGLHFFVDVFLVVGAEPQFAVHLAGKHEGAALGFSVPAHRGQILYLSLIHI